MPRQAVEASRGVPMVVRPVLQDDEREKRLFALLLAKEEGLVYAIKTLIFVAEDFSLPDLQELYRILQTDYDQGHPIESPPRFTAGGTVRLPPSLTESQTKHFQTLAMLAEREFAESGLEEIKAELKKGIDVLRAQKTVRERRRLEEEMRDAERQGDTARIADLMKRFADLQSFNP